MIPVEFFSRWLRSTRLRCEKRKLKARRLSLIVFPVKRLRGELVTVMSRICAMSLSFDAVAGAVPEAQAIAAVGGFDGARTDAVAAHDAVGRPVQ